MTAKGLIIKEAYLEAGISDIGKLSELAGLSRNRTCEVLNEIKEEVEQGTLQFGFFDSLGYLGAEVGRAIRKQRRTLEEQRKEIEAALDQLEPLDRKYDRLLRLYLKVQDALNKVNGVDIVLAVAKKQALNSVRDKESNSLPRPRKVPAVFADRV